MPSYEIQGRRPLRGIYKVSGAKNAGPKLPIAALLSDEPCVFSNIPRMADTYRTITALAALGAQTHFEDSRLEVTAADPTDATPEIPADAMRARQAVLFMGAALARFGRVVMDHPKGDAIGRRPLDRHLGGIEALGGRVEVTPLGKLDITMPARPESTTYTFDKNTHCGTENLILASVFNQGKVILKNAAEEPEVENLIECLNSMGAEIVRTESRTIEITGVEPLLGAPSEEAATSIHDRLEAATALALSAVNGGEIEVKNVRAEDLALFTEKLEEAGVRTKIENGHARITELPEKLKPISVETDWHPGFMTDWQPLITLLLAVKAEGVSDIHERIYEQRWRHLKELEKMGVEYELYHPDGYGPDDYNFNESDWSGEAPYGARVRGPTKLRGAEVQSHDVRAGVNMILAGLVANGTTIVHDPADHIGRAYENFVEKLIELGARIKKL